MTLKLLTAIALWCSTPINPHVHNNLLTGSKRTLTEVQACRDRLRACINSAFNARGVSHSGDIETCFVKERLP